MRAGVWVGLVCVLLWLCTAVQGVGWCCGAWKRSWRDRRARRSRERQWDGRIVEEGRGEERAFGEDTADVVEQSLEEPRVEVSQPRRTSVELMKKGLTDATRAGYELPLPPPTYQKATL